MRLQTRLILFICSLLFLIIAVQAFFFNEMWTSRLKEKTGSNALQIAKTVASIPAIREAFDDPDPSAVIQPIAETVRQETGAEFVVVGNRQGIRYSHPIPARIGHEMVGGDNGPVFEGKSIVSEAQGTLGLSLRGKTPVLNDTGKVVGVVSVGFLIEDINQEAKKLRNNIILITFFSLLFGSMGAILIANRVKRSIHGLEPEEIGRLYQEKQAILESIREGILAVNQQGRITMANHAAVRMLGLHEDQDLVGKPILDLLPSSRLPEVIKTGQTEFDREMVIRDQTVIANRLPILDRHRTVIGAVATFRIKSELYLLSEQLSQVQKYAETLRAQTHEYSNKLYAISGLIQLESYEEALELITKESDVQQDLIQFIMREIPDPVIGGLLIGKFNHSKELKINLEIDRNSSFRDVPPEISRNHLLTIIGNLIDNAFEAALANGSFKKSVTIFLTDLGDDLILEVEDSGPGIPADVANQMFETGFSTKSGKHRGFGLALVKQAVDQLNGYISYKSNPGEKTLFTVVLPKRRKDVS